MRFGGRCVATQDAQGRTHYRWVDTRNIWAVGFDQFVPGNRSPTVNHLRLWAGRAIAPFDVEAFNAGRHAEASIEDVDAKNVSRILYPDDTTPQGKELRFKQQYFFVSASLQDMLAQHLAEGRPLESLPDALVALSDNLSSTAMPAVLKAAAGARMPLVGFVSDLAEGGETEARQARHLADLDLVHVVVATQQQQPDL